MNTNIGLWIDHHKAVIVSASEMEPEIQVIWSHTENQMSPRHEEPSTSPQESPAAPVDEVHQRTFTEHLHHFYKAVMACVREADSLLIFGPDEAKKQLHEQLMDVRPRSWPVKIETADTMTDRQILTKVCSHFQKKRSFLSRS